MAWTERYCRADAAGGGDGTTDTNSGVNGAWTLAEAVANEAAGMRINVKAGTYASTTTSRTLAAVGTTTAPIWWRGFSATPGDLDEDPAGTPPLLTFTTANFTVSGAHHRLSRLSITSAITTAAALRLNGAAGVADRVRAENTAAAAGAGAVSATAAVVVTRSWFKCTASASQVALCSTAGVFRDCTFHGGGIGVNFNGGGGQAHVVGCVIESGGAGVSVSSLAPTSVIVERCSIRTTAAGVTLGILPTTTAWPVTNCIFSGCSTGIANTTGTNTNFIVRLGNLFQGCTANESGFGDSPSVAEQADTQSPWVNAAGGDYSLATGSNARGNGTPGLFENETFESPLDVGAVQVATGGTGGGGLTGLTGV